MEEKGSVRVLASKNDDGYQDNNMRASSEVGTRVTDGAAVKSMG